MMMTAATRGHLYLASQPPGKRRRQEGGARWEVKTGWVGGRGGEASQSSRTCMSSQVFIILGVQRIMGAHGIETCLSPSYPYGHTGSPPLSLLG